MACDLRIPPLFNSGNYETLEKLRAETRTGKTKRD